MRREGKGSQGRPDIFVFYRTWYKMENMRLQKFIANSGYCSRRKAEKLIADGQSVYVNDKLAVVGMEVGDDDEICIDGMLINGKQEKVYIKLNKPAGYSSTSAKFKNEKNGIGC